ncbi:hypothetical protein WJX74_006006 [Apatococcus lobatus]|uniref:Uncharacterized protein n=1 Tax=Apatococcus lobatus TaxID=904363 RepID=A0AAW1QLU3_9CHLO
MESVTTDMISYVRDNLQGQHDHALDILKSGLKSVTAATGGSSVDTGRLFLAKAEIHMDQGRWADCLDAAECARRATDTVTNAKLHLPVLSQAFSLGTRALLASGRSREAIKLAHEANVAVSLYPDKILVKEAAAVAAESLQALAAHAEGNWDQLDRDMPGTQLHRIWKLAGQPVPLLDSMPQQESIQMLVEPRRRFLTLACAWDKNTALSQEDKLMDCHEKAGANSNCSICLSPMAAAESQLARQVVEVQACMQLQQWEQAEDKADSLVVIAESISSREHSRVAVVLAILADIMAHTQRVTLAEGLFRQATKLLALDPSKVLPGAADGTTPVHPTVTAWIAWRYVQLLTVLPRRGTEVGAWQEAAESLLSLPDWPPDESRSRANEVIRSYYGCPERLRGVHDPDCHGCLLDVTVSRMLPCKWKALA